jgi:hypothetical protein
LGNPVALVGWSRHSFFANTLASALLAVLGSAIPLHSQISVQVNLVNIPVTVTGRNGQFVGGLRRENFRLLVDGAEQPIEYFASEEVPARVLVLVETGPAVFLLRGEHLAAAGALLENLAPADQVAWPPIATSRACCWTSPRINNRPQLR